MVAAVQGVEDSVCSESSRCVRTECAVSSLHRTDNGDFDVEQSVVEDFDAESEPEGNLDNTLQRKRNTTSQNWFAIKRRT